MDGSNKEREEKRKGIGYKEREEIGKRGKRLQANNATKQQGN